MIQIFLWSIGWVVGILVLVVLLGVRANKRATGLLIDSRGRYSLTKFQLAIWTIVVMSLIAGTFFGRWQEGVPSPLEFTVPAEVLTLMGISLGSTVITSAVKAGQNTARPEKVAASFVDKRTADPSWKPQLAQIFLQEEGAYADRIIDITKFQNFLITIVLVLAYIGTFIAAVHTAGSAGAFKALPGFGTTFLLLLGISHGAYIAGKLPSKPGEPPLSLERRDKLASATTSVSNLQTWSNAAPGDPVSTQRPLAVVDDEPFILHWTTDKSPDWKDTDAVPFSSSSYIALIPTDTFPKGATLTFTRRYANDRWEKKNHTLSVR